MSKRIILKLILLVVVLIILLAAMPLAFWSYQQSQKSISLYVNPDFKLCNYNSFYYKSERGEKGSYIDRCEPDICTFFRDSGIQDIYPKTEVSKKTLYILSKGTNGLVLPPHIGRFNPQIFMPKTLSIEVYNGKTKELLLKLYTWRGIFNYGYELNEELDKFKDGLTQAGWKEKKDISISESNAP